MEENRLIRENERLDDLQNGYMLIQNPSLKSKVSRGKIYRFGDTAGKRPNGQKKCGL